MNTRTMARGLLCAVLALATHSINAQQPGIPAGGGMQAPSSPFSPQRNVDSEVSTMTKRYGLSADQATKIRAILNDEQQNAQAVLKDNSLPPQEVLAKMKSLRDDETTRVSAILTPEQQKKYEADAKQMQSPPSQAPGGFPPPPGFPGGPSSN